MKNCIISEKNVKEFVKWENFTKNEWLSQSNKDTAIAIESGTKTVIIYSMGYSVYTGLFAQMVEIDAEGMPQTMPLVVLLKDMLNEDDYQLIYEMLEEMALTPQGYCHDDEELLYELFGGLSTPTTQHCSNYEIKERKEYMFTPSATETDLDHLFGRDGMLQPAR